MRTVVTLTDYLPLGKRPALYSGYGEAPPRPSWPPFILRYVFGKSLVSMSVWGSAVRLPSTWILGLWGSCGMLCRSTQGSTCKRSQRKWEEKP